MKHAGKIIGGVIVAGAGLLGLLKDWEGTEYEVYLDGGGVPTVCMGITGSDLVPGKRYTQQECDDLLARAATQHAEGFLRCAGGVRLSQQEADAYFSWTYNVGVSAACASTLVKKLKAGEREGACKELLRWTKDNGVEVRGLVNRRRDEYALCMKGVMQ